VYCSRKLPWYRRREGRWYKHKRRCNNTERRAIIFCTCRSKLCQKKLMYFFLVYIFILLSWCYTLRFRPRVTHIINVYLLPLLTQLKPLHNYFLATLFTFSANHKLVKLSFKDLATGLTLQNINALESPPNEC